LPQKPRFSREELDALLKKLTAHAIRLFAQVGLLGLDKTLHGTGVSPEDLAADTIAKLLSGELRYHRSKGRVDKFLATVMKNDMRDLLRSKAHSASKEIGQEDNSTGDGAAQESYSAGGPDPFNAAATNEIKRQVYALARGDPELADFAYAVLELEAIKPQDIAQLLKTDATDIQNRKKRWRRRLAEYLGRKADKDAAR
jgi:DNA-directed RNA polymerase specialized sigma24 family protein